MTFCLVLPSTAFKDSMSGSTKIPQQKNKEQDMAEPGAIIIPKQSTSSKISQQSSNDESCCLFSKRKTAPNQTESSQKLQEPFLATKPSENP
jgi:hypothetical protein